MIPGNMQIRSHGGFKLQVTLLQGFANPALYHLGFSQESG